MGNDGVLPQLDIVAQREALLDRVQMRLEKAQQVVVANVAGSDTSNRVGEPVNRWLLRKSASLLTTTRPAASAMTAIC